VLIGVGSGILSMNSTSIPAIKKLITHLTISKAQDIAKTVLTLPTAHEVEAYLKLELKEAM
jgi:phosphotransferase system enzyme I (PtsI)